MRLSALFSIPCLSSLCLCGGSVFLFACSTQHARQLPKPAPPPLEFLGEWGTRGDGPGELRRPVAIATDFAGNVYIADAETKFVHKFTPEGRPLLSFNDPGLKGIQSIAVDRGGGIYVSVTGDRKAVIVFYPDGSRLRTFTKLRVFPEAMAVDDDGNLFTLNLSAELEKLSPTGRSIHSWHKRGDAPGQFAYPSAITVGPDGFLYVADMGNGRVQKLTRDLDAVAAWSIGRAGQEDAAAVVGIAAFKTYLFLVLLEQGNYRLEVRSLDGAPVPADNFAGRLSTVQKGRCQIAVSPRGELFLLDSQGSRVLHFRINL